MYFISLVMIEIGQGIFNVCDLILRVAFGHNGKTSTSDY